MFVLACCILEYMMNIWGNSDAIRYKSDLKMIIMSYPFDIT